MSKEFVVTWDDFHVAARALGQKLKSKGSWKGICAVTRGGMIPACLVAQETETKLIKSIALETYTDYKDVGEAKFHYLPHLDSDGEGWLIIDDLADTGKSFREIRKHFPKAHYACVYVKPDGAETADTFLEEVSQDTWIYLPWEFEAQKFAKHLKSA